MAAVHYEEEKGAGRRERQKVTFIIYIYLYVRIYMYICMYMCVYISSP